ncbi:protein STRICTOSIDINE SYNTHASE-LIKE 3-like [Wolffia australiana]
MGVGVALAGVFMAIGVYCGLDPLRTGAMVGFPGFDAFFVDQPPWSELPKDRDPQNLLQKAELRFFNQVQGPESVVFDPRGGGPYVGVADGRVLFWDGSAWSDFAYTSPNRSEICDPKPLPMLYLKNEHICGRPLGLRFDKNSGDLYIADAYFGLLKVGPEGRLAKPLSTESEGVPLRFTNDLDIDDEGNVYFTDSSTNYQRRNFMQLIFTAEPTGRLLKYDPLTQETSVLVRNLQFPNGVSLSKDKSFLVFCEGPRGRLTKYWLKGEKKGTTENFALLPGFPDNVRTNENGEFWVALHCRRGLYSHVLSIFPRLRKLLLKLPITARQHFLMHIGGKPHGIIAKYGPDGKMLKILEDREGKVVKACSEVEEKDGKLWIGSVLMPFIAVYNLS